MKVKFAVDRETLISHLKVQIDAAQIESSKIAEELGKVSNKLDNLVTKDAHVNPLLRDRVTVLKEQKEDEEAHIKHLKYKLSFAEDCEGNVCLEMDL